MAPQFAQQIARHKRQAVHYMENARHYIDVHDAEKASEFLWGAISQAVKALALSKNKVLRTHRDIERYAREFSRGEDIDLYDAFGIAQRLHANFYEIELEIEDVAIGADRIERAVSKILAQIPDEIKTDDY